MKGVLLTFIIVCIISCTNHQQELPKAIVTDIKFNNKIHDFGNISSDTTLVARFYFKNIGNNILLIKYVNPDCSCTGFHLNNDSILPDDSAYVELKFDTRNKFGKQKVFTTLCANTNTKFYALILKANIVDKRKGIKK